MRRWKGNMQRGFRETKEISGAPLTPSCSSHFCSLPISFPIKFYLLLSCLSPQKAISLTPLVMWSSSRNSKTKLTFTLPSVLLAFRKPQTSVEFKTQFGCPGLKEAESHCLRGKKNPVQPHLERRAKIVEKILHSSLTKCMGWKFKDCHSNS